MHARENCRAYTGRSALDLDACGVQQGCSYGNTWEQVSGIPWVVNVVHMCTKLSWSALRRIPVAFGYRNVVTLWQAYL